MASRSSEVTISFLSHRLLKMAMASVSFEGATGKVAFDEFGDSVSRVLTVYAVTDGAWAAKKTGELK